MFYPSTTDKFFFMVDKSIDKDWFGKIPEKSKTINKHKLILAKKSEGNSGKDFKDKYVECL